MLILLICASFLQLSLASRVSTSNPKHGKDLSAYMKLKSCCESNEFMCRKGLSKNRRQIIPNSMVCDGTNHCPHGEDEICTKCAFPPSIPFGHASINVTIFTVGSTVFYNCDEGYIRVGNEFASCQTDGSWTDRPECKLLCSEMLPIASNAIPQSAQPPYRNGAVVIYACLPGFSRVPGNDNAITCMPDGSWEGAPACIPMCPTPPAIPNGSPETMDTTFPKGASVNYVCEENHAIIGPTNVICQAGGVWTTLPECKRLCLDADIPMFTDAMPLFGSPPFVAGSTIIYECVGRTALTSSNIVVCLPNGAWDGAVTCDSTCGPPSPITFGFIFSVPEVVTFGSFVTYACHEGFVLIGPEISACLNGGWSQLPTCVHACPTMLPVFEHAFPVTTRDPPYLLGDLIRYECEECFALAPGCDNIISCGLGAWQNDIQCVRECINPLPTIPNAMPLEGYSPPHLASDTVVYECQDGFVMNSCGPNYVTCQADGEWSDGPSCIPDSPLECEAVGSCTVPIWDGGKQWRLCEGGGDGVCSTTKGRLELFHAEEWRPLCTELWNTWPNLLVACKMFGFQHSVAMAEFGTYTGDHWVDDLVCTGSEENLLQCDFDGFDETCASEIGIICTNQCKSII